MAKRSSGGKSSKPAGAGPRERGGASKPAAKAAGGKRLKRGKATAAMPGMKPSTDRTISLRKISNGHIVRESFQHPKKGYVERETFVPGKPKITITGAPKRQAP